jgi:phage FluMu protein Com
MVDTDGVTQEIKKTNATWVAQLLVECPYCGEVIDILRTQEWRDDWAHKFDALENKKGVNAEIECPKCKLLFVVEDVEW